jgi:exodeoxyribonuclease-3
MKIISWNVNGLRAVAKKDFFKDLELLDPDILCLQETKAQDDQVALVFFGLDGYEVYSSSAEKKGYSGTAILTRHTPLSVSRGMGIDEHDKEGRVLCLEFQDYYLVNAYVPNSGNDLKRLDYRQTWDLAFFSYLKELEESKPVVACGDFNVAHRDIDLARPKPNYNKSAGFMQEEIDGMDRYTSGGLEDTFRHFYPDKEGAYSWWSYRAGARGKNVGWRIDYILVSSAYLPSVKSASILSEVMGSDHCPVQIEL